MIKKNENNYGADSIRALSEVEKVQMKPGVYIGSTNIVGLTHLFYEILSNSIDEALNGYGDKIIVRLIDKNTIEIEDFGRGIPFGISKSLKKEVLEFNLSTLHAGGKMDNTINDSAYSTSGGTNGLGVAIVNFLSTNLYVHSWKNGEEASIEFVNQKTKGAIIKPYKGKRTGTLFRFTPDLTFFKGLKEFSKDRILEKIKDQIYLEKITIVFEDKITNEVIEFTNNEGISKYLSEYNDKVINNTDDENSNNENGEIKKEITPITGIIKGEDINIIAKEKQNIGLSFSFEFVKENKFILKSFTNSISNPDGGTHRDGLKNGIIKGIKELLKYRGGEGEKLLADFKAEDIMSNIIGVVSIKMPDPQFESQIKGRLTSEYILKEKIVENEVVKVILTTLEEKDINNIIDLIKLKIKNRKKDESSLMTLVGLNEKDLQKKLPSKLLDAIGPDKTKKELFIVEGDSAGGNIQTERNPEIHAIMPLRGKLSNSLNAKKEALEKNQEINNMIYAISAGNINDDFDINKHLRYGKIIIAADADADGRHIQNLVISFFIKFYYSLIEKGHLYIANTPLFSASLKDEVHYFYTEQDKDAFLKGNKKKYHISRFKGLGEMNSGELGSALLNTKYRSLHKVTIRDGIEAKQYVESLLSESNAKYDLIQNYQAEYLDKVDNDELGLKLKSKDLVDVVKDNSIEFALEDNLERKIPYIEDGMKTVYRRILYALKNDLKSKSNEDYLKSAKIVGNVIGDYHPHGDSSAYEAMVGLIQEFRHNHQLIDGKGAYGSIFAPNTFAAYRYTKAKISKFSEDFLLDDLHKKPVPFVPNYANTLDEPVVFPAKLPMALIFGLNGIGFGYKHDSVSHNIREVIDATIGYLEKKKNDKYDPLQWIKGPDLPTGGIILNTPKEIRDVYENKNGGSFRIRIPLEIAEYKKEDGLLISNVPTGMFDTERIKDKIKELLNLGELFGIKKMIDLSGGNKSEKKKGFQLFLSIDKTKKLEMIKENLYDKVKMAGGYGLEYTIQHKPIYVNRFKELKGYTLADMISTFVNFRRETIVEILNYDKEKFERELKTLNNKILFALNIDKIVKIIKENDSRALIKSQIIKAFPKSNLDDNDAEIIIETKLIQIKDLKNLESEKLKKEKEINKINTILGSEKNIDKYIINELKGLRETVKNCYRKTQFLKGKDIETINNNKQTYKDLQNQIEKEALIRWNYIVVDKVGFITRDNAVQEQTIDKNLNTLLEDKKKSKIDLMLINKNDNSETGKLYVINENNAGYFVKLQDLSLKISNEPLNKKIPKYKGGQIISTFYHDINDKLTNNKHIVLYEDAKGNIGSFTILTKDIVKTRQGFSLFNNGNHLIGIYNNIDSIDLSNIVDIRKYKPIKNYVFGIDVLPGKKSFSSGKILLKK